MSKKIKTYLKASLAIAVMLFTSVGSELGATHIVGSDMTFQCLGNDFYQIDLTVRRDCENGAEDAPFDNPAFIGIFDNLGNPLPWLHPNTLNGLDLELLGIDIITPGLPSCAYLGGEVCVEEARYRATVFLPFREKGYVLAYQRCCRNVTLNNVVDPLNTGTTNFVCLTEETLTSCNSMPTFGDWPDVLICAGQPLVFDHPATDSDGDSLSYELYTPHAGASESTPKPTPPPGPQYDEIEWAQGFGLENLMGGDALQVDPVTGTITALPSTIGQYLIGVLVIEWRDGIVLSKTRRNFEYNVRACEDVAILDCNAEQLTCDGLSVAFNNTSIKDFGFNWNFNYPSDDPAFQSTEESPTFTFPEEGFYTVRLSSTNPENDCEIFIEKEIGVFISEVQADFSIISSGCVNEQQLVRLTSTGVEPNSNYELETFQWEVVADDQVIPLFGSVVDLQLDCSVEEILVSHTVKSSNGCSDQIVRTLSLSDTTDLICIVSDTIRICVGDAVALTDCSQEGVVYTWTPTTGLTFSNDDLQTDPIASPTETTLYTVTASNGVRNETGNVLVIVDQLPEFDFGIDSIELCRSGSQITTIIDGDASYEYEWSPSDQVNTGSPYSPNDPLFSPTGDGYFHVTVTNGACVIVDSMYVEAIGNDPVALDEALTIDTSFTVNSDGSISLTVTVNWSELVMQFDIDSVYWTITTDQEVIEGNGMDISATLMPTTMATICIFILDSDGCTTKITRVLIGDSTGGDLICLVSDTVRICIGNSEPLTTCTKDGVIYNWTPTDGLTFGDPDVQSDPVASPDQTTLYTVTATDGINNDSAMVLVIVDMNPEFDFGVDSIELCRSGSQITTIIDGDASYEYEWSPSDQVNTGSPYSPNDPLFSPTGDGYFHVTVTNGACVIVDSVYVEAIGNDPVALDEALTIDTSFTVNSDGSISLTVTVNWSELVMQFDIDSVYWTITTDQEVIEGNGMDISATLMPTTMATVCIFIVDNDGCTTKITRVITFGDLPDPMISFISEDTISVCFGDTSFIVSNPNSMWTYTWEPEDGLIFEDPDDRSNPTISPTESRFYFVTVSNGVTSIMDSIFIEAIPLLFDIVITEGEICSDTALVRATNNPDNGESFFEWSLDPDFTTIVATGGSVEIPVESGSPVTIYVRGIGADICGDNSTSITLEVDDYGIVQEVTPINTCISNEGSVSLVIPDTVDVDILWTASDNITTEDLTSTMVDVVALDGQTDDIELSYQVTDADGCVSTQSVIVPVEDMLEVGIDGDEFSCTTTGTFNATANANLDSVSFEWSLDPDFITIIGTDSEITADLGETGIIYLRGTAGDCVSNVASRQLEMRDIQLEADAPSRICLGDTADVDIIIPAGESYTITWEAADEIISELSGTEVIITAPGGKDTITLVYTADDGNGCIVTDEIKIPYSTVVDPNPVANIVCGTLDMNFAIDPIYMDGDVLWDFGNTTSTDAAPTITFDSAGLYQGTISSTMETCNFDTTDFFFEVPVILVIDTDQSTEQLVCEGDSTLMLRATSNGSAITWTDQDNNLLAVGDSVEVDLTSVTSVTATTSDASGCTMELVFNISEYQFDVTTDAPADGACVEGGQLVVTAMSGSDLTYMWTSEAGSVLSGADSSSVTVDIANASDLMLMVMDNEFGCTTTIPVPVNLGMLDVTTTSDAVDNTIELGESTTITVMPSGSQYTYMWDDGSTDSVRIVMPTETTTYTVKVTDTTTGCMGESSITITVNEDCTASITSDATNNTIDFGGSTTLTVEPQGDFTYTWSDGVTGNPRVVSPTDNPTTYTVVVTDNNTGCTSEASITITVNPAICNEETVGLPNAFSPNGDNVNDIFYVRGNIETVDLQVIDRWGKEVFRGTTVGDGWNGRHKNNGNELAPDVYAYSAIAICPDGTVVPITNHVNLIR